MSVVNNSTNTVVPSGVSAGSYTNANITVNAAGQVIAASSGSSGNVVNVTGTTQALAAGTTYMNNNTGAQTVFTLPATAAIGDEFDIIGTLAGAAGWQVAMNSGQTIHVGTATTTTTTGTITTTNQYDQINIRCTATNTTFVASVRQGNLTVA